MLFRAVSIFNLHSAVLGDYHDFASSFFTVADARVREFVERSLNEEARLWPDFLLQVSEDLSGTRENRK